MKIVVIFVGEVIDTPSVPKYVKKIQLIDKKNIIDSQKIEDILSKTFLAKGE